MLQFLVLHSEYTFQVSRFLAVIKLCIFTMRSSVQKFKIARKSLRSNPVADVKIFLIPGYISMDFVFVFIDFMLFFRFCKFAVNISICDINWFVCSLKVFHVMISSSFSVRRQLTSVLYLVQGWQNVLSVPFVTYVKISWLLLISKTFCFF